MTSSNRTRIGFVGTGIMGGHMARRLARAGFSVKAWNRTADKAEALVADGFTIAGDCCRGRRQRRRRHLHA